MQTVFKAKSAADFLALVPALAGYTPTRSIALVAFEGARTLGVLRVDLPPDGADEQDIAASAATFIGLVCRLHDADGIAPVVYCDEPLREIPGGRIAHAALIDAVLRCADACGLRVRDALCVASDAWCSYLEPAGSTHRLTELDAASARAALPLGLDPITGDQRTGVELPHVDLADCEHVSTAIDQLLRGLELLAALGEGDDGDDDDDGDVEWLDDSGLGFGLGLGFDLGAQLPPVGEPSQADMAGALGALCDIPALFEGALGAIPESLGTNETAALLVCLARPSMRDVALSQRSSNPETGTQLFEAQLAWEDGAVFPAHLAAHMVGEGPRPDVLRISAALALVRHLSAIAPVEFRCAPLTVAAWLSWAMGKSTHAGAYLDLVHEIDPEYGLAQIVSAMVRNGHLPEWAFDRPSTV